MPHTTALYPALGLALLRLWGEVTPRDAVGAAAALARDPAWEGGFDAVWDLRRATSLRLLPCDEELVAAVAGHLRGEFEWGRSAFVVRRGDEGVVGQLLLEVGRRVAHREGRVFGCASAGAGWLGVPVAVLEGYPAADGAADGAVGRAGGAALRAALRTRG